jgi:hypothetical protein
MQAIGSCAHVHESLSPRREHIRPSLVTGPMTLHPPLRPLSPWVTPPCASAAGVPSVLGHPVAAFSGLFRYRPGYSVLRRKTSVPDVRPSLVGRWLVNGSGPSHTVTVPRPAP